MVKADRLTLIATPSPSEKGCWDVKMAGKLFLTSPMPLFSAARKLLRKDLACPSTILSMVFEGGSEAAARGVVGALAVMTIIQHPTLGPVVRRSPLAMKQFA